MSGGAFDPEREGWAPYVGPGFIGLAGPFWTRREGDDLLFGLLAEERHTNRNGGVHGGMLMTVMDHAMAVVSWHASQHKQATIQLDTQFVSKVALGDFLVIRSEVVRRSRSLNFMRGTGTVKSRIAVTANGIWKMLGSETGVPGVGD